MAMKGCVPPMTNPPPDDVMSNNPPHPTDESRAIAPSGAAVQPSLRRLLADPRTGCGWIYLGGLVLGVPAVFVLPGPVAMLILWALVVSALVIAAQDAGLHPRDFISALRTGRDFLHGQASRLDVHRDRITRIGVLTSIVLLSLSAIGFRPANRHPDLGDAVVLMLLGMLALWVALVAARPADSPAVARDTPLTPARSDWLVMLLGVLLLLAVAEINGRVLRLEFTHRVALYVQGLLFYGGIACVVWGLAGSVGRPPHVRLDWRTRRTEWVLLGVILLIALGLRVFGLDTTLRVSVDEAVIIPGVFHVWNTGAVGLVSPPSAYQTTLLFSQWQTVTVGLFGTNLVGLRMASAITGTLGVLALYLLARTLFDRPAALLAALLLATFPPHIHFSRIALLHIADPLFGTLALAFAARGVYHNRRLDWALAGAALGLTHYFFEAGRLFYTPLVVGWVVILLLRQPLRTRWPGLVVMGLAFLFTILPAYYTLLARGQTSTARLEQSGLNLDFWQTRLAALPSAQAVSDILHRLSFPFQVYVHQHEIAVFYGGEQALVLEYLVPLFLLGVGYLLWQARGVGVILILWLIATALSNALLRDSAVYARWVVVFPAVALSLAIGLRYALTLLTPRRVPAALGLAVALLIGVGVAAAQAAYYYGPHLTRLNAQARIDKPYPDTLDAALRAVESLPPQTDIVIVSTPIADANVPRAFVGFMLAAQPPNTMTLRSFNPIEIDDAFLAELPADRNIAFFLQPNDADTLARIRQFYRVQPASPSPYSAVIPPQRALVLHFAPVGTRIEHNTD